MHKVEFTAKYRIIILVYLLEIKYAFFMSESSHFCDINHLYTSDSCMRTFTNSEDPDKSHIMWHFIRVYTVC